MEHVNDWCFRDIYKGGLWDENLHVCALGQHTLVCNNGMSVVDYLLASPVDITHLSNFKILDFNEFSDHAPVFLTFLSQIFFQRK